MVLIESWILRLPCIDDESKIFTTIMPGYALENHVIARYHRMNVEECKRMCFDELQCRSINHSDQNVCELNDNINQTSNQGDFKAKPGSTYITTNYSSKNVCSFINIQYISIDIYRINYYQSDHVFFRHIHLLNFFFKQACSDLWESFKG